MLTYASRVVVSQKQRRACDCDTKRQCSARSPCRAACQMGASGSSRASSRLS
jgi:hypothetical protein